MPLLRSGITGFDTDATVDVRAFKRAVFDAAQATNASVTAFIEARGTTPNFHQADVNTQGQEFSVLCNRHFPLIAFFERPIVNSCLKPVVETALSEALCESGFELVSVAELQRKVESTDLAMLSEFERKQVHYWKPKCVADILFNWWD